MARFEYDASQLDGDIVTRLKVAHDVTTNQAFEQILAQASERLAEYFRGELQVLGLNDTGQLIDSVKPTDTKTSKDGAKYRDVYPQGNREKDGRSKVVKNATVGFAHEYGVHRAPPNESTPAQHWMSNTVDNVAEEILNIIQQGVEEILKKEIGG